MSTIIESNPRGIPKAPFVENVSIFLQGDSHEQVLAKFQEMINKYRFMETHLLQRQQSLESKIPEIKKSFEMVEFLAAREDESLVDFELNDTLWLKAKIPPTDKANVMLEYPIKEAEELLESKLKSAEKSLEQVEEDLDFLKEQITTMEVNMARVYNDDVRVRRIQKQKS